MPINLYYQPSFQRSLKRLGSDQRKVVALILEALGVYFGKNCDLTKTSVIAPRFFYKQLRKPYYEAGVERNLRVVLRNEGSKCIAVLAGNHDQIIRFLSDV